ncbi:MAG: hypothetical protein LKI94_13410 [Sporolactobacillus sp.]|nr:hypothetical protein [Sporolactobacillus sp.]
MKNTKNVVVNAVHTEIVRIADTKRALRAYGTPVPLNPTNTDRAATILEWQRTSVPHRPHSFVLS